MLEDKPNWLDALNKQIGEDQVSIKESCLQDFSHDETEDISKFPDVVVRPENSQDVSIILKIASKYKVPVTPAAARTGLSGGSIPVFGGISLSMERFSRIIEIDESNSQATVEPGVINQVFHDACREKGLFYPPDPSSWGSSTLGGNVAYNAGGPKAVKYGVTSSYVLNLEVVLPNGEIIWTGANTLKNSTGYNLTQLFVGSEGTLGVITKIVVRLLPYPMSSYTLLAPFKSSDLACKAVEKIFRSGRQKNGRVNGISFGQSYVWSGPQALYGYKIILENYRANTDYEFYENYGLEFSYSQPLGENWQFSSKYSYQDKSHDKNYPLFGARHDQMESVRFNMLKSIGACWSLNLGLIFNDSRSTISIYKRRANNFSAQINYQCFK